MKSEIAKRYKAVGQLWIHSDKQLINGKVVSRSKDNNTVNPCLASFNNNVMTNLDEFNAGYIDKQEVTMEIRADDGKSFSVQTLLDPGSCYYFVG